MLEFLPAENDKEIKILSKLAENIWNEYWPCILKQAQIDYMVEKFQSYQAIKNQIENENYIYKVICLDGENAGYFGISKKDKKIWVENSPKISFEYLFLSKLYLKKEFRAKGLGYKAFLEIKKIAENTGLKYIYLTVNKYNENTIKAYEKWGFETVETAVSDIGSGFIMDDYIMRYALV